MNSSPAVWKNYILYWCKKNLAGSENEKMLLERRRATSVPWNTM